MYWKIISHVTQEIFEYGKKYKTIKTALNGAKAFIEGWGGQPKGRYTITIMINKTNFENFEAVPAKRGNTRLKTTYIKK